MDTAKVILIIILSNLLFQIVLGASMGIADNQQNTYNDEMKSIDLEFQDNANIVGSGSETNQYDPSIGDTKYSQGLLYKTFRHGLIIGMTDDIYAELDPLSQKVIQGINTLTGFSIVVLAILFIQLFKNKKVD